MTDGTAPGPVIEIQGLRKTYRSRLRGERTALDGFDMVVERGQVHGFLGPNGSGKTTTLRTLLGLVRADGGRMSLLGRSAPAALPEVMHRVGAIVESPQFFGNFTGRRTLLLLATAGGLPAARVDEVLEQVGLRDRGNDRVRGYSLGMKQRLAVASALLKSPELLILDEPANGLDPAGIREMRDMMRELALAGVTVLLSSHILAEVEALCDGLTIIRAGRTVLTGTLSELRHLTRTSITAETSRPAGGLDGLPGIHSFAVDGDRVSFHVDTDHLDDVVGRLAGLGLRSLTSRPPTLEELFLRHYGDELAEEAAATGSGPSQ